MTMVQCLNEHHGKGFVAYHGDSCDVVRYLPDNSVDMIVYSPPFGDLFTYSDSVADLGNSGSNEEFLRHYEFLASELLRVLKPGRLCWAHCSDLPTRKWKDGFIGINPLSDDLSYLHRKLGWILQCRTTIRKCPVTEMQRTKALGLLHKQVKKDSTMSRTGMPDYLLCFRKPGENAVAVSHTAEEFPVEQWQEWAEPVWDDIRQTNVLNVNGARDHADERHVCLGRGSLVLTRERGYVPIETVSVGDFVLTHMGRWRQVTAVRNTGVRPVVRVKAHGVPGLVVTPDHKLWTRMAPGARAKASAKNSDPRWVRADETIGSYVNQKLPPVVDSDLTERDCWLIGRWLADGHVGTRGDYFVSIGFDKLAAFDAAAGENGGTRRESTAMQIRLKSLSTSVTDVLSRCGRGAAGKTIPSDILSLPAHLASKVLDGYLSGDGHYLADRKRWLASSVSKALLLGLSMLAQRVYGCVASVYAGRAAGETTIEGRTVRTLDDWVLSFDIPDNGRRKRPFVMDDGAWKKVRSAGYESEPVETWCIRVDEDESFSSEGCVVKNCPLQLDLIRRTVVLATNPGEVVFSPFMGIGSEGYVALQEGRKFIGIELKESYWRQSIKNLSAVEGQGTLDLAC